jgi:ABC-type Co2+ transport system permease subunit
MSTALTWILIAWPVLSAIITTAFRRRTVEELKELPPRFAAFIKLVMALGIDVPRTLDAIIGILQAKVPGSEAKPQTAVYAKKEEP